MAKINVCLRLYFQADSESAAQGLAQEIENKLRLLGLIEACEMTPYWKIPDCYGGLTTFAPVEEPERLFRAIYSLSEHGWNQAANSADIYSDPVWNHKPGLRLLSDSVRWAHLFYTNVK